MGLCALYYVEYRLYNVKKVGFFYLGWNYTLNEAKYILQSFCQRYFSHFQGKKRSRTLLIFNDLGKKLNDRIKVCILIKSTNFFELILAVVPLCYEFYNFYSANVSHRSDLPRLRFCALGAVKSSGAHENSNSCANDATQNRLCPVSEQEELIFSK